MTEKELIELYRRQMAKKKASAPEGLWDEISRKLLVEEAWDHIAAELDKDTQKRGFWYFGLRAAAVAAIISIGVLGVWMLDRDVSAPRLVEETQITTTPATDEGSATSTEDQQSPDAKTQSQSPGLAELPGAVANEQADAQANNKTEEFTTPQQTSSAEEQLTPVLASLPEALIPLTGIYDVSYLALQPAWEMSMQIDLDDLNLSDGIAAYAFSDTNNPFGSFSLGITTAIKNTWLINNETFEGFDRLNHNRTDLKFYPDIGINLHYQHTHRWGLETGLFMASHTGQTYRQYIHGRYSHKTISLNYLQWELMASHTSGNREFQNAKAFLLKSMAGFYASVMNSATEIIENDQSDVKSRYSGFDYGILLGQYLQWRPIQRFVFSPGIHVKWGLSDIYHSETPSPVNFSHTYNRSIEFRLNIYYTLGQ